MKKLAVLFLCIILISACQPKKEEKEKESSLPKQPEVIQVLSTDLLILMAKIDIIPSTNMALEEKKKNDQKAAQKEKEISDVSDDRLAEKDRKKHDEEKIKVKISSFTLDNSTLYELLKKENIKEINELENEDLPFEIDEWWHKIKKEVNKIHETWNEVQAKLTSVSVSEDLTEKFESDLISLTKSIEEHSVLDSLVYANNLTKYMSDFKMYYKSPTNNTVEKMKYSVRKAVLLCHLNRFDEAIQTLDSIMEDLNKMSQAIQKENKDTFFKIKYAIEDLKKSIEDKDLKIINIKAPILINNLNEIKTIKD
ncbi:hypothetical protein [Alkalithermobacter paradoxus]|uniref:Lipoprotein n=1 Tax=Alkalithermobacter paradoxus TaxID=29349 RepID=A0A1V4I6U1_9FIRM|nr:hypothetical protein CLOTH_15600 [[Clostridium] thermoalcaliphilum]